MGKGFFDQKTSLGQMRWIKDQLQSSLKTIRAHLKRFNTLFCFFAGIAFTLFFILCFSTYIVFDAPPPWKVVDASDRRFDPMKFQFPDYLNEKDLWITLNKLFPVGTDKSYVDNILGTVGHAKITRFEYKHPSKKNMIDYRYSYNQVPRNIVYHLLGLPKSEHIPSHYVSIEFDEDMKVKKIFVIESLGFISPLLLIWPSMNNPYAEYFED